MDRSHLRDMRRPGRSRYGAGGALLLGLLLCATVNAAATPIAGSATFTDPSGRYALSVPPEWQSAAGTEASRAWQSQNPAGSFRVDTAAVAPGTTLDDYTRRVAADAKQRIPDADVDAGKAQSLTLGGLPARRLDYTGTAQGTRLQMAHIVALQNNVAYVLTASAPPASAGPFMDRVRAVLDSFSFLTPTAAPAKGDNTGRILAAMLAVIALLALVGLLRWRRARRQRLHRRRTPTQPITGLGGPPGVPVPDDPPAKYPDSPTAPLALGDTTALPAATDAERR